MYGVSVPTPPDPTPSPEDVRGVIWKSWYVTMLPGSDLMRIMGRTQKVRAEITRPELVRVRVETN